MSNEKTENTEHNKDSLSAKEMSTAESLENSFQEDDQKNIDDIDALLKESDPDFFESLSKIKINADDIKIPIAVDSVLPIKVGTKALVYGLADTVAVFKEPFLIKKQPKKIIIFWTASLAVAALTYFGLKYGIKTRDKLFMNSLADLGLEPYSYNVNSETENFFDNTRFVKNLITLPKMITNIKPSESSGQNPMISLEVVIEGFSNESILEIKDREAEFKDMILRVIEEYTYDELDTLSGKQRLNAEILEAVNANLTQGQIRKVFYKNIITKP